MRVWQRYFLSNMAILNIYVKFQWGKFILDVVLLRPLIMVQWNISVPNPQNEDLDVSIQVGVHFYLGGFNIYLVLTLLRERSDLTTIAQMS